MFYGRPARIIDVWREMRELIIMLGDFNAKVVREPMNRQCNGCHSLHEHSNDNGSRLVQFAAANNLVVGSTKFAYRDIYKITWAHPDGESFNQIYHVLVSRRWQSSLLNVRTYWGANIDSDHYLVGLVIRCKIARPRANGGGENTQPRLNTDTLRDITVQQELKAALDESLLPENRYETTSGRYNALKSKIINCTRYILPPRRDNTKFG